MRGIICLIFLFGAMAFGQRSDFYTVDFEKADSIAMVYRGASLKNLPLLTYNLTSKLNTEVERFRAIYTWICTNIENDYHGYITTSKKRKKYAENWDAYKQWNDGFTPKVFQKLIEHRKTACTGYAYLTREMAGLANINCKIINGFGRTAAVRLNSQSTPNHSWNAVFLNDKWYLCDATWSAGSIKIEDYTPEFQGEYHDGYFLADPLLFVKNHYPLNTELTFLPHPPTFDAFIKGPLVYKEAFTSTIIPVFPEKMHLETAKNNNVIFSFHIPDHLEVNTIDLVLNSGKANRTVKPSIEKDKNILTMRYTFDRTGRYDVHLKVDNKIVATYVVRVKRN
ncbi:transglutaminase domain-containing protein [Pareuzebyella sediminis]|uniref:transglutaminase domain-containing protein n=1 Tax=Pareuzebyella sediminis TaxID=2607998 RepID=UPI0011EFFBA4|nr:transglutaminase domain-containing protein [Pareuzebyella sediminis]